MPVLASWPPAARVTGHVLSGLGVVVGETDTALKDLLADNGRVIRVRRVGGTDDGVTDRARVDVNVYAVNLSDAEDTAELARQRLVSGPYATPHGVLDRAVTDVGPHEIPSPDSESYRIVSTTYRVSARRR